MRTDRGGFHSKPILPTCTYVCDRHIRTNVPAGTVLDERKMTQRTKKRPFRRCSIQKETVGTDC
jgi:hypothetical protein